MDTPRLAHLLERGTEDADLSESRLHAAFLLFVSGGILCLVGAALLVAGQFFPYTFDLSMRFVLRHAGGVVGGIGAVALFAGIVGALSTRPYMRWLAVAGGAVALTGVVGFGYAYPYRWGVGADLSVPVILTLAAGFSLMVGATFAAVVSNLILRQRIRAELRDELGREPTQAEVERDVEEALSRYEFTWGGTRVDRTKGLEIQDEPTEGLVMRNWKPAHEVEDLDVDSLDRSTQALTAFRGGVERTGDLALDAVDQKGAALADVRRKKAEEEARRLWNRFKAWLAGLWHRLLVWLGVREPPDAEAGDASDEATGRNRRDH